MLVLMFALVAGCATVHRSPEGELSYHTYAGAYGGRLMIDGNTLADVVERAGPDTQVAVSSRVDGVGGRSSRMTIIAGGTQVQYGPGVSPEGLSALAYRQRWLAENGAPQTGLATTVSPADDGEKIDITEECPTGRTIEDWNEWNVCQDSMLMRHEQMLQGVK